jgi:multicomponent Na+:H+ antiporter subunit E
MTSDSASSEPSRHWRLIWALQSFCVLILIWVALNGKQDLWLGLVAAAIGAGVGSWLASGRPYPWRPHRLLAFTAYFLWESLRGGVDVAWRAMHPRLQIDPCFTRYSLQLPSGQPRTLMLSVISLLPGTLSADMEGEDVLLVHALTPQASSSIAPLEGWISWLFSLEQRRQGDTGDAGSEPGA